MAYNYIGGGNYNGMQAPSYSNANYGEQLAQQQAMLSSIQDIQDFNGGFNNNNNNSVSHWYDFLGPAGTTLFGTDTYQTMLNGGMNKWGIGRFGQEGWNKLKPFERVSLWNDALNNTKNSPERYSGGLFGNNGLGTFSDIAKMGLGVAGILNQKRMLDRQYQLGRDAFNLEKQAYSDRESRAKEEFAARRLSRSGSQI